MLRFRRSLLAASGLAAVAALLLACVTSHSGVPCDVSECRGNLAIHCWAYFTDTGFGSTVRGVARDCPTGTTCKMVGDTGPSQSWSDELANDGRVPACVPEAAEPCTTEGELTCGADETPKLCVKTADGALVLSNGVACASGSTCRLTIQPATPDNGNKEQRTTDCVEPSPTVCATDSVQSFCEGNVLSVCYIGQSDFITTDCGATEHGSACVQHADGSGGCEPPPEPS